MMSIDTLSTHQRSLLSPYTAIHNLFPTRTLTSCNQYNIMTDSAPPACSPYSPINKITLKNTFYCTLEIKSNKLQLKCICPISPFHRLASMGSRMSRGEPPEVETADPKDYVRGDAPARFVQPERGGPRQTRRCAALFRSQEI